MSRKSSIGLVEMNRLPLSQILGIRFALRNQLKNKKFHNSDRSIPKDEITLEKEPHIFALCDEYSKEIVQNPNLILLDTYALTERQRDWTSLVAKEVLANGEILAIDARSKPGHKILDHHMPHFWDVQNHKGISVRSCFTEEKVKKALFTNILMHSTPYPSELRKMLIMTAGLGSVTKYRTITAKSIVQYFNATRVFDPCVGWGGRMLGTLSANETTRYVGCEPDTHTSDGLINILNDEAIPKDVTSRAEIYNDPVELVLPTLSETFDMILTSPPYYNLEIYTSGDQSTKKFPSWDDWVSQWLKPTILGCLELLTAEGTSCWSVKNFRSNKHYPLADVVKKIHEEKGWRLVKTVKMVGSARMGSKRIQDGKSTRQSEEETFCFQRKI